jgi:hypothetical protein
VIYVKISNHMLFAITTGVNNDKLTTSTTTAISYCDRITKLIGEVITK